MKKLKLLIVAAAALFGATNVVAETRYGLFVGINEFDNAGSLTSCDWDAAAMYDAWTTSGGCPTANASLLANRGAKKAAVRAKFAELATRARAGDTVVYYQSSHGGSNEDDYGNDTKDAYLCMTDGYYEDYEFADDLLNFADDVRIVVLIDACNSGGMFKAAGAASNVAATKKAGWDFAGSVRRHMEKSLAARKGFGDGPQVAFITAADWDEVSYETEDRQSEFTLALLDGWAYADADYDWNEVVSFGELAEYAADFVPRSSVQYSNKSLLDSIYAGGEYDRDEFRLICADGFLAGFYGTCPSSVVVPEGVFEIGWSAFDCDYNDAGDLVSISFPSTLTKIGAWAFYECANLASVSYYGDFSSIQCPTGAFYGTPVINSLFTSQNDAFADAIEIYGAGGWEDGWNYGATRTDAIDNLTSLGSATVWWIWTAPASGVCSFDTFGSYFDTKLSILAETYSGYTLIGESDDSPYSDDGESEVSFAAEEGVTYCIGVSGYSDYVGSIALNWLITPPNDDFANATWLYGDSGSAYGWNYGATAADAIDELTLLGNATVWWSWTAPYSGDFTFDTFGSYFDTKISILTPEYSAISGYLVIAENDDTINSRFYESEVTFAAEAGRTYYIGVSGYRESEGDICLNWTAPGFDLPPANDPFWNAYTIYGGSGTEPGDNYCATRTDAIDELTTLGSNTVWWTWTAPYSGECTFDTFGSDFDTRISILSYQVSSRSYMVLAENDDAYSGTYQSEVTFTAEAGVTYCIGVSGFGASEGMIVLNWFVEGGEDTSSAPANDSFANATELYYDSGTAVGWNYNATRTDSIDEMTSLGLSTVWWTWTAPYSGECSFNTFGSRFDTKISVLEQDFSTPCGGYAVVAENDDTASSSWNESEVTFDAEAGVTYYIGVSGYGSATGDIVLNWSLVGDGYYIDDEFLIIEDGWVVGVKDAAWDYDWLDIEIPYGVVGIDDGVFEDMENLLSVYIPGTVEYIGEGAFAGCYWLEDVCFEDAEPVDDDGYCYFETCLEIGESAFADCESLMSIYFPPQTSYVGESAFIGCTSLESVEFGADDSVVEGELSICDYAFAGCEGLISVYFESHPCEYSLCDPDAGSCNFFVYIGEGAFADCEALEDVEFGDGVCEIGDYAFEGAVALEYIWFPRTVEYIGSRAFGDCENLWEVEFQGDIGDIDIARDAFENVPCSLVHYRLEIDDDGVLRRCVLLSDAEGLYVEIPECVYEIAYGAFRGLLQIECVYIPESVDYIAKGAFAECYDLCEVEFERDMEETYIAPGAFWNTQFNDEYGFEFTVCDGVLTGFLGIDIPDEVEIPDDVWKIEYGAFDRYYYSYDFYDIDGKLIQEGSAVEEFESIWIPESVEIIDRGVFSDCSNLWDVEFEGAMEDVYIGAGAFWNTPFNDDHEFEFTIWGDILTGFLGAEVPEEIVIPDGVCEIATSAFDYDFYSYEWFDSEEQEWMDEYSPVQDICSVYIPKSVEVIGMYAFWQCDGLEKVEIANPDVMVEGTAFVYCRSLAELIFDYPGHKIVSMTLTGYCDDDEYCDEEDWEDWIVAPDEEMTIDADFSALFEGIDGEWLENVWVTFNWGKVASGHIDTTGSGETAEVELVIGEAYSIGESNELVLGGEYGDALSIFQPESTRRGQVFAGWLINGVPFRPGMIVREGDVITASWKELEINPLCATETEDADTSVANVYDGYVLDKSSGASVGIVQVKVGKMNARDHRATVSASAQLLGGKKITGFKAEDGGKVDFSAGTLATKITLVKAGQSNIEVYVGKNGLSGTWGDYKIAGVRNASKGSAAEYQAWTGVYNVVLETESATGAGAAFAEGYSFISVTVAAKGKVKAAGVMADGTKVNCSGQLLIADGGTEACVSILAPMYAGKSGGISFVLWVTRSGYGFVESISDWKADKSKTPFTAKVSPVAAQKLAALPGSLRFSTDAATLPAAIAGGDVQEDLLPTSVAVGTAGGKFTVAKANKLKVAADGSVESVGDTDNDAALKLTYTAKTGAFKGSFSVYTLSGGKLKRVKANVTGGMVGNTGYGSAVIKGVGAIPVTLTVD